MAIYHKNLKYHEDTTPKHKITEEEIEFLKELQKEMNTQDHVCQADPRYWVIQGSELVYGIEDGYEDDSALMAESEILARDLESAVEYIREKVLPDINELDGIERTIQYESRLGRGTVTVEWEEDGEKEHEYLDGMSELVEWLKENGHDYNKVNYCIRRKNYDDTMFLTEKDAAEHLRQNDYHYSEDAHTYAMTAWRNPRVEKLYKILQEVDFDLLKECTIGVESWEPRCTNCLYEYSCKGQPEEGKDYCEDWKPEPGRPAQKRR